MPALGQLKTSYLSILTKLKKLFFTAMLPETLVFHLLCQELKELNKQRLGIDVTDTLSTAAYVNRLLCKLISVCISYPFFSYPVYNALRCISSLVL